MGGGATASAAISAPPSPTSSRASSAWAARRAAHRRTRARRRSSLQHGDHAGGGVRRQDRAGAAADLGDLRGLLRQRRQGRHQAEDLPALRRPRPYPPHPGRLLHARTHLPDLPGPRPGDRGSLSVLLRLGPGDARAHAVGQYSAGCRGRHPHPACRRRRGRRARRSVGRPLHFPVDRRARFLPARWRRPALPRAGLDGAPRRSAANSRCRRSTAARHASRSRTAPSPGGASGCRARACRCCARTRPATCMCRSWSRRRRT